MTLEEGVKKKKTIENSGTRKMEVIPTPKKKVSKI
jgi:hypothetical protein